MKTRQRHRQAVYKISFDGKWHIIPDKELESGEGFYGSDASLWDAVIYAYQNNPLEFFMAHGAKRGKTNDGILFINDWESDITLMRAPSKVGKSYMGAAKAGYFAGPCKPEWQCFSESHGITYREWPGDTEGIISSFSWDNVAILWNTYLKLWPREWLGPYSPNWGMFHGEHGRQLGLTFGDGKPKKVKLPCGVTLTCLCDTQREIHWESRMADWSHVDEQLSENKFDILLGRFQTSQLDFNPLWCTLTPFVIDDRPDTGAGGWMKRKIVDGGSTKGRTFAEYTVDMESVPDAIVSHEKKKKAYIQNIVEPQQLNDDKKEREGRARYYAEWQSGGGSILSAWNPDIHWIQPFDVTKHKPSYYRMIDHGENPCAAIIVAHMPWDDLVIFKEYYEYGRSTQKNAMGIVEMCGNEIFKDSSFEFEGNTFDIYDERFTSIRFDASEMDGKSYGQKMKESGRLIGEAYNGYGLKCTRSDCRSWENIIPLMQQMFELDPDRQHINTRIGRDVPEILKNKNALGAPRIYVFNTCPKIRWEIEGWHRNPKTARPVDKDDHLISCVKFLAARPRLYSGDWWATEQKNEQSGRPAVSDHTGY